jgi:glutathione S-transferase
MTGELYWLSGSPYAWRTMLALEIKKVPYVSRLLDFSKGQTKTPEYLELNPRGRVPALKDGDFVLTESIAILVYLDRKFPAPPLFGRTAEETGRIWKSISECFSYIDPAMRDVAGPVFFGGVDGKAESIREAAKKLHAEFKVMESGLQAAPWLAGGSISAADIATYPFLELTLRASGKDVAKPLGLGFLPFAQAYPAIHAWMERIRGLPGYERTYPPHWREADKKAAA